MKLHTFISRLQALNISSGEILPETQGKEIASFPANNVMDVNDHFMPTRRKCEMIEQGFDYIDFNKVLIF